MATIKCRIDVKNGKLSFDVGHGHVEFNLFKACKFSSTSDKCHGVDVVDRLVREDIINYVSSDLLEHCMLNDGTTKDENPEVVMCAPFLEVSP